MERKRRSKASMYRIIERWQSSGLSQSKFCREEKLPKSAFGYWLRKYKKEKGRPSILKDKTIDRFIPVEVRRSMPGNENDCDSSRVEVFFPNGVHVNCPSGIEMQQLKTLINF